VSLADTAAISRRDEDLVHSMKRCKLSSASTPGRVQVVELRFFGGAKCERDS